MNVSRFIREPVDATELQQLLPAPPVPPLSDARHEHLKETFMQSIDELENTSRPPLIAPAPVPTGAFSRNRRGLALVAAACVGLVAVTGLINHRGQDEPPSLASIYGQTPSTITVHEGTAKGTGALLDRIATVASSAPTVHVRGDQFVYVKSVWVSSEPVAEKTFEGPRRPIPLFEREVWLAQGTNREGLIREQGRDITLNQGKDGPNVLDPDYAQLSSFPTEPVALLALIRNAEQAIIEDRQVSDADLFDRIGSIFSEQIVPPKVQAALYRCAATLQGVQTVKNVSDISGRRGVAIARTQDNERTEWIFDPHTLKYLGQRSYLVEDSDQGKAGTLMSGSAVLARGVANGRGDTPTLVP
jgi:hypothetical protein